MNLKELFTEDRGVSPVIGVILMVAITVILAAVIGAFVLGLGDQASSSAPQAQFSFSYDSNDDESTITVEHAGGQNVDRDELSIRVAGESIYSSGSVDDEDEIAIGAGNFSVSDESSWGSTIRTGDRQEIKLTEVADPQGDIDDLDGEDVSVIWSSPDGGSSNTLATSRWSV